MPSNLVPSIDKSRPSTVSSADITMLPVIVPPAKGNFKSIFACKVTSAASLSISLLVTVVVKLLMLLIFETTFNCMSVRSVSIAKIDASASASF